MSRPTWQRSGRLFVASPGWPGCGCAVRASGRVSVSSVASGSTVRAMASNRQLRLLHASWTASWVEDWLVPVAMNIYAYSRGGAAAAGLAGVARMLPSTVGAPVLRVLVDRWRREVVLRVAYGVRNEGARFELAGKLELNGIRSR